MAQQLVRLYHCYQQGARVLGREPPLPFTYVHYTSFTFSRTHMYTHTATNTRAHTHAHTHACTHIHTYIHTYYTHIYAHTYIKEARIIASGETLQ